MSGLATVVSVRVSVRVAVTVTVMAATVNGDACADGDG